MKPSTAMSASARVRAGPGADAGRKGLRPARRPRQCFLRGYRSGGVSARCGHRLMLNYAAHSDGIDAYHIVEGVVESVRAARALSDSG